MGTFNVIIKVGKQSRVRLYGSEAHRAITALDITMLSEKYNYCHALIVENIGENEQAQVRSSIKAFIDKSSENKVLFYIPDNDEITSGIADEFAADIYLTLSDLYKFIYKEYGINVAATVKDRKEIYNTELSQDEQSDDSDLFETIDESGDEESVEDTSDDFVTDALKSDTEAEDIVASEKTINTVETIEEASPSITRNIEETHTSNQIRSGVTFDFDLESENLDKIDKLQSDLADITNKYTRAVSDIAESEKHSAKLEELLAVLKDENEEITKHVNEMFSTTEILEDPISLSEYKQLKEKADADAKSLKAVNDRIATLNSDLEQKKVELDKKSRLLSDSMVAENEAQLKIKSLESQLADTSNSVNTDEARKELEEAVNAAVEREQATENALRMQVSDAQSKITDLESSLDDKESDLQDIKEQLTAEIEEREKLIEISTSAFVKVKELNDKLLTNGSDKNELLTKINQLNKIIAHNTQELLDKDSDIRERDGQIKDLNDTVEKLNTDLNELNTRLELSSNYTTKEKDELSSKYTDLQSKYDTVVKQLESKEAAYNALSSQITTSSAGSEAIAGENTRLQVINKTLTEQLGTMSNELVTSRSNEASLTASLAQAKTQLTQLNTTITMLSSGTGNPGFGIGQGIGMSAQSEEIMPITYGAQAQIIVVTGSGSFGITTTAMSIMQKLSSTSKVLYIDYDMISPKADMWFEMSPICKNAPIDLTDTKMTGLKFFYTEGAQRFATNATNIVLLPSKFKTRGGYVNFIGGLYYTPSTKEIVTADYSTMLNTLGNMYNYIIIDAGRFGSSTLNDNLIKAFSQIAFKTVIVTTSSRFEVRNFKSRVVNSKIDQSRIAWLLNMCKETKPDDNVVKILNNIKYGVTTYDSYLACTTQTFGTTKTNKDRFSLFIDKVVFA